MATFSVVSNIASANAQANLLSTQSGLQKALGRLSSGLRINASGDDAAGLSMANMYRSEVAVLTQGIRNANDGLSDLQIKDGALNNISLLLDRLATLASQSASNTTDADARTNIDAEADAIVAEIDREAFVAGLSAGSTFSVFVSNHVDAGPDPDVDHGVITGTIGAVATSSLLAGLDLSAQAAAKTGVATIAAAVTTLAGIQGSIGALQNRLTFAISLAQTQQVNTKAAESRIRDANVAEESANMTRFNILSQSGIAALAQANQTSASVLALLR
jgi:flagellin